MNSHDGLAWFSDQPKWLLSLRFEIPRWLVSSCVIVSPSVLRSPWRRVGRTPPVSARLIPRHEWFLWFITEGVLSGKFADA